MSGRSRIPPLGWVVIGVAATAAAATAYASRLAVRGQLTLDLGVGRSMRPLGPQVVRIRAPRSLVFEQVSGPYLGRTPTQLRETLEVQERSEHMVLALHRTPAGRETAVTVETVVFEPPERIGFRLVRGPVPHVREEFVLSETPEGTELRYSGELGTDLGPLGRWWGNRVATVWERAVAASLEKVRQGAEARARSRSSRD